MAEEYDKEVHNLKNAAEKINVINQERQRNDLQFNKLFRILKNFISSRKLVIYGGMAINDVLPKNDKIYDANSDFPDYDIYSKDAIKDGTDLADIYHKEGFTNIELKSAIHEGTYKLFVNFTNIGDITELDSTIFDKLYKDGITINKMMYAPINYLRMSMYEELSRPLGNISRWEKVLGRLYLLNSNYPFLDKNNTTLCGKQTGPMKIESNISDKSNDKIFKMLLDFFVKNQCVFLGGYAFSLFSKRYGTSRSEKININHPDFDVLHEDPPKLAKSIQVKALSLYGIKLVTEEQEDVGEIIGKHILVKLDARILAIIIFPIKCDSYNTIRKGGTEYRIATIDTILNYYLGFMISDRPYFNPARTICMADFLFQLQQKNRGSTQGLLKRFAVSCYGHHRSMNEIRAEKLRLYKIYRCDRNSDEYRLNFFKYNPAEKYEKNICYRKTRNASKKVAKKTRTKKNKWSLWNIF
jgi:hypothetical protein